MVITSLVLKYAFGRAAIPAHSAPAAAPATMITSSNSSFGVPDGRATARPAAAIAPM